MIACPLTLVATDIAARGIDVEQVSHLINFDMPNTPDAYTHRIGRTGRSERHGWAYTFVTPADHEMVHAVERRIGSAIPREHIEGFGGGTIAKTLPPVRRQKPAQRQGNTPAPWKGKRTGNHRRGKSA